MKSLKAQFIGAIAMVLVAAIAMGSSTYAWFAMNTNVTATGMEVTAKSNSTYLWIDNVNNATNKATSSTSRPAAFVLGGTNTTEIAGDPATPAYSNKIVYPAYYAASAGTMPGTAAEGTNMSVAANTWYTANNVNKNNATNATKNIKPIASGDLKMYTTSWNAWLTLSEDSEDYTGKLTLASTVVSGDAGTSVVVYINDSNAEYVKLTNDAAAVPTVNDHSLTANTSIPVTIYVYIDGTTTNVYSDYIQAGTLSGTVSVAFGLVTD